MNVHLRQIPAGDLLHLEGSEDAGCLDLEEAGASPASDLDFSLDAGLSDGGLFATGRLAVTVRVTCVACLEEFEMEVIVDPFVVRKELDGRELVDLTGEAREDIHLALPAHPRCDGQGRRACPATFPQPPDDPSQSAGQAWDALNKLNTENLKNQ